MNKLFTIAIVAIAGLVFSTPVWAGEPMGAPVVHSKDFETMKTFVGSWEGTSDMGKGPEKVKVTYELTSAGNVLLERFAAGSPHEMVTMYYDAGGKLTMTHYCSLGNRPRMELKGSSAGGLEFVLSNTDPGIVSPGEMHMHALKIVIDGRDGITHTWTLYDKGEKKSDVTLKLNRVRM